MVLTREDDGEEDEEDELSVDPKRRENYGLIYERARRKTQCRLQKPEPNAKYQCRVLLLAMGADETDGGWRGWWGQARPVGAGEAGGGRRGWWGQARPMGAVSHRPHARAHQHRTLGKPPGQIPSQPSPLGRRLSRRNKVSKTNKQTNKSLKPSSEFQIQLNPSIQCKSK